MTHVLVTGSRHATDAHHDVIFGALKTINNTYPGPHTLIHGGAKGVDRIADRIAAGGGWRIRAIPADWDARCVETCTPGHRKPRQGGGTYCPAVGNYRNTKLVAAVAPHLPDAVGLAFPLPASKGTWDCVRQMKAAGIPVTIHPLEQW